MDIMTPRPAFDPARWQHHIDAAKAWLLKHDRLARLTQLAEQSGYELAVFGGAIRDLLLFGQLSNDIDCIVASPSETYDEATFSAWGQRVSQELGMAWVDDNRPRHWAVLDETTQFALDIAWCHDLTAFLEETDFSMNGIAFQMHAQAWLDPNNGLVDLSQRRLVIPVKRLPYYCEEVNRWTRLFLLMVHTNSQPTEEVLAWLIAHRAELANMTTHNPIGNFLKLYRAFSYPAWGAPYIVNVWAQTGFLSTIFAELAPWLDTPEGSSAVLTRWTQSTAAWPGLSQEQQTWLQKTYPEYNGITLLGMLRLAMVLLPVFTESLVANAPTPHETLGLLKQMIERLGFNVDPFPTILTQAITITAAAQPDHSLSPLWLAEYSTDFMQDYHHSLCELIQTGY